MVSFQSARVFALSIVAGLMAGAILAGLNMIIVQPYTGVVTDIVLDEIIADGLYDEEEFDSRLQFVYRLQTVGSLGMGLAAGALIGGVRTFVKRNPEWFGNAIVIAGVAWFVLYIVPTIKYPASAAALFYQEAASVYYPLYFGYMAVSGLAAVASISAFMKSTRKGRLFGVAALYFAAIAAAFLTFPDYQLDSSYPESVLNAWRASISVAMTTFWLFAGLICWMIWRYAGGKGERNEQCVKL